MEFHPNELFLLYNPHTNTGKQTKALALDICSHINEVDVIHEKLSPTYWKEIVNMLGIPPDEMLDHTHADYKTKVANNSFTMNGWLDVLAHDPHLISGSIVIFNHQAIFCHTPTDIFKLRPDPSTEKKVLPHLKKYQ